MVQQGYGLAIDKAQGMGRQAPLSPEVTADKC